MGRPRKPIENLSRVRDNRGYNSTELSTEIQKEIILQFYRIQKLLLSSDIENDIKKYEILIDILLKINNQVKTFNIKKSEELEVKELLYELETTKEASKVIDKLIDLFNKSKDDDLKDVILYKLYQLKNRFNEEQNSSLVIPFLIFEKDQKQYNFKETWENNKYKSLIE